MNDSLPGTEAEFQIDREAFNAELDATVQKIRALGRHPFLLKWRRASSSLEVAAQVLIHIGYYIRGWTYL